MALGAHRPTSARTNNFGCGDRSLLPPVCTRQKELAPDDPHRLWFARLRYDMARGVERGRLGPIGGENSLEVR